MKSPTRSAATAPHRPLHCAGALMLCLAAGPSLAACAIANDLSSLNFGNYNPLTFPGIMSSSDVLATSTVTVNCSAQTQAINYTLQLSAGYSNNTAARSMAGTGGGDDMRYNLYTNASYTTIWGDTAGNIVSGSLGPAGGSRTHTVYGRIPGGQSTLRAGHYSDLLLMTLEYVP